MAEQNVGEQGSTEPRTGRHAAPDDAGDSTTTATADGATADGVTTESAATESAATESAATESAATESAATTSAAAPSDAPTQHVADAEPAAAPTHRAEAPTQQVEAPTQQVERPDDRPTTIAPAASPEQPDRPEPTRQMERPQGPPPSGPVAPARGGAGDGARRAVRRVTGFLATLLRIVGLILALVLVAFVVLTLVGVNPDNGVAQLVAEGADVLVLRFRDLFLPADPRLGLVVNYGLAALFWLVLGLLAARVVRALGRLV